MLKLIIGFGSILFFIAMIALAVYYIKQYLDEKNDNDDEKRTRDLKINYGAVVGDVLEEIDQCISFIMSLPRPLRSRVPDVPYFKELSQGIIDPLEKMIHIIERHPDKANNMQEVTEYIIPLTRKLADDYCFYHSHIANLDEGENNSSRAVATCKEGLEGIGEILYKKVDSMLEDRFYDIQAEVAAFLQLHPL